MLVSHVTLVLWKPLDNHPLEAAPEELVQKVSGKDGYMATVLITNTTVILRLCWKVIFIINNL